MENATLEDELQRVLDAHTWNTRKPAAREALALLLGWSGNGVAGLDDTGRVVERTGQRVRQFLGEFIRSLRSLPPATPTTSRALALLRSRLPCSAEDFEDELLSTGLSQAKFRVEGLLAAALVLGHENPAAIFHGAWPHLAQTRVLVAPGADYSWLEDAHGLVRAWRLKWGCVSLVGVERQLGRRVREQDLRLLLTATSSMHPLDATRDWHAVLPLTLTGNRMYARIVRTVAIAREVTVEQLRRGLERDPKHGALPFSLDVLREFCRVCPGIHVEGDVVRTGVGFKEPPFPRRQCQIVGILRRHGGAMPRGALFDAMSKAGWEKGTAKAYVRSLPFVVLDGASYSLVRPAPAAGRGRRRR